MWFENYNQHDLNYFYVCIKLADKALVTALPSETLAAASWEEFSADAFKRDEQGASGQPTKTRTDHPLCSVMQNAIDYMGSYVRLSWYNIPPRFMCHFSFESCCSESKEGIQGCGKNIEFNSLPVSMWPTGRNSCYCGEFSQSAKLIKWESAVAWTWVQTSATFSQTNSKEK